MSQATNTTSDKNPWHVFHVVMLGVSFTGFMLAYSAGDMGAFSPLLVAQGVTLIFLSASCESIFFVRWLFNKWIESRKKPFDASTADARTSKDPA